MINYTDPRYQRALLALSAKNTYGSTPNTNKVTSEWVSQQTKDQLGQGAYGIKKNLNEAKIAHDTAMMDVARQRLGLEQGRIGLGERKLRITEKELGMRQQGLDVYNQNQGWRQKYAKKYLDDQEVAMNLGTVLGGATTLYSAYEANRRSGIDEEARLKQKKVMGNLQDMIDNYNRIGLSSLLSADGGYR